jgi:hypothetical protein
MTRYPLYWRLHGLQGQSGLVWKKNTPTWIRSPDQRYLVVPDQLCASPQHSRLSCYSLQYQYNVLSIGLYRHLISTCILTCHIAYMLQQTSRVVFNAKCYIPTCPVINHYITTSILMSRVWCDAVRLQLITVHCPHTGQCKNSRKALRCTEMCIQNGDCQQ